MTLSRIVLCGALLAGASAIGQMRPGDLVAEVPFAFHAGTQTLPPGRYIVAAVDGDLRISNSQGRGLFVPAHAAARTAGDGTKLVFHRYGDTYFLSAVWVSGNSNGRELFRSRAERELASHKAEMDLAVIRPEQFHPAK